VVCGCAEGTTANRFREIVFFICFYNLWMTAYLSFFFFWGHVQAAWTPPATINLGQMIFATIILFQ
jgi:hypothetical protein